MLIFRSKGISSVSGDVAGKDQKRDAVFIGRRKVPCSIFSAPRPVNASDGAPDVG